MLSRKCTSLFSVRLNARALARVRKLFSNTHSRNVVIQHQGFCSKPGPPHPQQNDDFRHRVEYYMAEMAGASQSRRTILVLLGCSVVGGGAALVMNRHHVKATVSSETADVIKDTMQDERLQVAAGDLSKAIINSLLTDSQVQEVAQDWIWKVLRSLESQIADLFVKILNSDVVLKCIRALLDDLVAYLCANETVQARVADLLIRAIDLPVAREFSAQWVVDVCTQDWVRDKFVVLVNDTLSSPEVAIQASDVAASVVKDPHVQEALRTALISLLEDDQLRDLASDKLWAIATGAIFPQRKNGTRDKDGRSDVSTSNVSANRKSEVEVHANSSFEIDPKGQNDFGPAADSSCTDMASVEGQCMTEHTNVPNADFHDREIGKKDDASASAVARGGSEADGSSVSLIKAHSEDIHSSGSSHFPMVIHHELRSRDEHKGFYCTSSEEQQQHRIVSLPHGGNDILPDTPEAQSVCHDDLESEKTFDGGAEGVSQCLMPCAQSNAVDESCSSSQASPLCTSTKSDVDWVSEQVDISNDNRLPTQSVLSQAVESVVSLGTSLRRMLSKDDLDPKAHPTSEHQPRQPRPPDDAKSSG